MPWPTLETATLRSILSVHGVSTELCDSFLSALAAEDNLGSALDVHDSVVEPLLGDGEHKPVTLAALSTAIFAALASREVALFRSGAKKRHRSHDAPASSSGGASSAGGALPSGGTSWLDACSWKREFKSERERFHEPYVYELEGGVGGRRLEIEQRPFEPEGFASTVWDSAIVLSRYLERRGVRPGAHCVELGAGCGLPGLVLASLGARVTLTDLPDNLPLLQRNVSANAAVAAAARVVPLPWVAEGEALPDALLDSLRRKAAATDPAAAAAAEGDARVDFVVATDVFYSRDAVPRLVATLAALAKLGGDGGAGGGGEVEVLVAAGRNRHAADEFFALAAKQFEVVEVTDMELHPTFQCEDVDVWTLHPRRASSRSGGT